MNIGRTKILNFSSLFFVVAVISFFLLTNILIPKDVAAAENPSCVTAKCHTNMGKENYVHGPASVGQCTICHQPTAKHEFKPITNVGKVCNECHDKEFTGKNIHPPVKDGECTGCHDPHQSPYEFFLLGEGENLCFICHDKGLVGGKYIHGPVAEGGCSVCHSPHESDFPKLLMAEGNDVCFFCHEDKADAFQEKKHIHSPVEEACTLCHSPHSGNFEYNFSAEGKKDLCLGCHDDIQQTIGEATAKHAGLETDKLCLACHDPHVADYAKQLSMQPAELCLSCHDREYTRDGEVVLADMKAILEQNKDHHGPIRQNDCSACHSPHGSSNYRMLLAPFPDLFYTPYQASNYELCYMCHENTIPEEQFTTTLTGFRNGNQNLHFVHVNKKPKGRTCRSCHDAHATNNLKHVRDEVPFGAWQLPINFEKTETGGRCLPGCHQLFGYDRNKPVKNR
jgi:predicted CXXCH cytochrome family protein